MLRQSARQLCADSSVYQYHVSFPFVDGTHSYSPTLPAGTEVARYISVSHGVRLLEPATLAEFFSYDEEYPFLQGIPTHYATEEFSSLKFYPVPDADAEAEASCIVFLALCPTNTATGLDQDVFSRYREGIVDGAAARLMAQPDKPWSNPQLSSYYAGRYRAAAHNNWSEITHYQGVGWILYGPNAVTPENMKDDDYRVLTQPPMFLTEAASSNAIWNYQHFGGSWQPRRWTFASYLNNLSFVNESNAAGGYDTTLTTSWDALGLKAGWTSLSVYSLRVAVPIKSVRVQGRRMTRISPASAPNAPTLTALSDDQQARRIVEMTPPRREGARPEMRERKHKVL